MPTSKAFGTLILLCKINVLIDGAGADPGFDRGGPQIVTGLKLPFWGLSFVEFWCWGLIFGGQGGARAPPPLDPPLMETGLTKLRLVLHEELS